jgi:hypothetical protein
MKRVKQTQHAAVHSMDARQLTEFASCSESAAPVHASTKSDHAQWLTPAHGRICVISLDAVCWWGRSFISLGINLSRWHSLARPLVPQVVPLTGGPSLPSA